MASTEAQQTCPATGGGIADANNQLGDLLFKSLANEPNVFMSPLSISTALAMLYCATRGDPIEEMDNVLGYASAGLNLETVPSAFSKLLSQLGKNPDSYVLSCANSIAVDSSFDVKDTYKNLLKEYFEANLFNIDVKNQKEALKNINGWVAEKTNKMITELLTKLSPLTVVVLLNAIYFKGQWEHQFKKKATHKQKFYNNGLKAKAKNVDMMNMEEKFRYTEKESFQAIELPYVGKDISMFVFLPRSMDGLGELIGNFSSNRIKDLRSQMMARKVKVSLPKFKMEYSKSVKETFEELGMKKIFKSGVDLGGMSDNKYLEVSDIVHKAVIDVNEEGSEAAAATAVVIAMRSLPMKPPSFIAEHPFMFVIYDTKRDLALFVGKVDQL